MSHKTTAPTVQSIELLKARPLLTAKEVGMLCGISELTARRMAYSGRLESVKIGNSLRFKNTFNV
jgi:excisionase family DNA binding protein